MSYPATSMTHDWMVTSIDQSDSSEAASAPPTVPPAHLLQKQHEQQFLLEKLLHTEQHQQLLERLLQDEDLQQQGEQLSMGAEFKLSAPLVVGEDIFMEEPDNDNESEWSLEIK